VFLRWFFTSSSRDNVKLFVLPDDLPIELTPFAFLIGNWKGSGVVSYSSSGESEFLQSIKFAPIANGKLQYESWVTDMRGNPISSEHGYWMLSRPNDQSDAGPGLLPGSGESAITVREDLELWRNAPESKLQRTLYFDLQMQKSMHQARDFGDWLRVLYCGHGIWQLLAIH